MFGLRYILLATAALAAATAMPYGSPRLLKLSEMINNTVCAIDVVIDENPDRIPQRIKMMKCAKNTAQWCVENNIKHQDCCQHSHNRHAMECVEMTDVVAVYYTNTKKTGTYSVSVGCACIIGHSTTAATVPGPT